MAGVTLHKLIVHFAKGDTVQVMIPENDKNDLHLAINDGRAVEVSDYGWNMFEPRLTTINGKLVTRIVETGTEQYV